MADLFLVAREGKAPCGPDVWVDVRAVSRRCVNPLIGKRRRRVELLWETASDAMEMALPSGVQKVTFRS